MIKSSFKKIDKVQQSNKICFGHADLDAILNNSINKGHIMILQQDHPTIIYRSLQKYYINHHYHQNIPSIIYDCNVKKWLELINPIYKNKSNIQQIIKQNKSQIAWRYDKMNINLNTLQINSKIQWYDLTKNISNIDTNLLQLKQYNNISLKPNMKQLYRNIEQSLMKVQKDDKDMQCKKILLGQMPISWYNNEDIWEFIRAIRCLARTAHTIILICIPSTISQVIRHKFMVLSDYYMQISKISASYQDFNALLKILKQVETCQIRTQFRGISLWGIKNQNKHIRIQNLYEQALQDQPKQQIIKSSNVDF